MDRQTDRQRFYALDAFRGLCAIFVCVFHTHILCSLSELEFFRGSSLFVEFFFVLSGFVMAHSYGFRDELNFKRFISARFFRLYPLHFVMFLMFVLYNVAKLIAIKYIGLNFESEAFTDNVALGEIIPNLLLVQSWTNLTDSMSFNYPSWSISVEFYMYILFFITLILFRKFKTISWGIISILVIYMLSINSNILTYSVTSGLSCFFGGATIYYLYRRISDVKINYYIGSAVEILLVGTIILMISFRDIFEYQNILTIVTFFIIVLFFAFERGCISLLLRKFLFQYLGKLSYSIYMTHAFILMCYTIILRFFGCQFTTHGLTPAITTGSNIIDNLILLLFIMTVIICSHFTYEYIEQKGQQIGKRIVEGK